MDRPSSAGAAPGPAPLADDTVFLDDPDDPGGEPPSSSDGGGGALSALPHALGDVLGERYRLVALIGEGGLSWVYQALDMQALATSHETGMPHPSPPAQSPPPEHSPPSQAAQPIVALKILRRAPRHRRFSFTALQAQFERLRNLRHPHIVPLYDCQPDGATAFITMEYLPGESLRVKRFGPTDPAAARAALDAIAAALVYAHGQGVVHGDLKPANVIMTGDGRIKVIDFGMVDRIATPRYASPQVMAREQPQAADDVYALACLAYELTTGTPPFAAGADPAQTRPAPPLRAGLNAQEYAAILQALQSERPNRTASVERFMDDFRRPERPRKQRWGAGAGAVLLILVGVAAWWYGQRANPPPSGQPPAESQPPPQQPPEVKTLLQPRPGTVLRDCPTCLLMTVLPAGRFMQGTDKGSSGASSFEQPRHEVSFARPFAMSIADVTVGSFGEFIADTHRDMQGCDVYDGAWRHGANASWKDPGFAQTAAHPVTCVSWDDATAYAEWLSRKTGHTYRLPSAAEWEYAARADASADRPWTAGGGSPCDYANLADQTAARRYPGWTVAPCTDGYVYTAPVGSFKANPFGLADTLGNVFQWTADCWHPDYTGAPRDGAARLDGPCTLRELRGGSWFTDPSYVRASYRNRFPAAYRTSSVGFRLVRDVSP